MNYTHLLNKLNDILASAKKALFYQNRIPKLPLTSISQLKQMPLTFKDDLSNHSPNGFIAVSQEELFQYHETSGTTGNPASSWYTKDDLYQNAEQIARSSVAFNQEDIILVRFPYSLTAIGHLLHLAAQLRNACVIPASARTPICPLPRTIDLMNKLKVTVLCCNSLQSLMLAETAKMIGYKPTQDFPNLRAICTAGELMTPGRRKLLEETWNVKVFDFYGMAEAGNIAADCPFGRQHVFEEDFIIEILDEKFETEVPDGTEGNLVITTLCKKGSPLIRYVTNDRAVYDNTICPCGRNKALKLLGRKSDVIHIKGRSLNLWDLDSLLSMLPYQRFWVAGPEDGKLKVVVEEERLMKKAIEEDLKELTAQNDWLRIELVPAGTLYDRNDFLSVGLTSKPKYIYSEEEIKLKAYEKGEKTD